MYVARLRYGGIFCLQFINASGQLMYTWVFFATINHEAHTLGLHPVLLGHLRSDLQVTDASSAVNMAITVKQFALAGVQSWDEIENARQLLSLTLSYRVWARSPTHKDTMSMTDSKIHMNID